MPGETLLFLLSLFLFSCAPLSGHVTSDERRDERQAEVRSADRKGLPSRPPGGLEKEKEAPFGHGALREGGAQRAFAPRGPVRTGSRPGGAAFGAGGVFSPRGGKGGINLSPWFKMEPPHWLCQFILV